MMSITLSTARWLAPTGWAVNFAAQLYGIFSSPSMKDVHDANLSFFSPQPYFVAAFFFTQQLLQLAWLWRLWKAGRASKVPGSATAATAGDEDVAVVVDYAPYYAFGSFCIAVWMIFWNHSALKTANVFVVGNSLAQLYYVFGRLPPLRRGSAASVLTHAVAKTYAGIGVLDLLHNGSVAYFDHNTDPSALVRITTGVVFAGAGAYSDWLLGGCLVYDLAAFAVGQRAYGNPAWSNLLWAYAGGTAVVVGLQNVMRQQWGRSGREGYQSL